MLNDRRLYDICKYLWTKEILLIFLRKLKIMVQDIDRDTVDRINNAACNFFGITIEQLYSKNKKTKICTVAFCHILYYLHYEAGASISQLAKEYNRKRRIISYHIANERDFMRIYDTTRKEYQKILSLLQENR
jgi:hypothetical protein